MPVAKSESNSVAPKSLGVPRTLAEPVAPAVPGDIRPAVAFSHAEGRVFFFNPVVKRNQSCSGGTVNSGKRRLVVTAGHCVHTGGSGGQWMQNWAFHPGYQFGTGPAGIFPLFQAWSNSGWTGSGNLGYDYAIAITQTNTAGQRIVDRVGGNGLIVNPGRPFVTAIAYPSNFQSNEQQAFCQAQLTARSSANRDQKLNCDLRFGASGGPWMRDYSDATTLGAIVSNQSYSLNADGSGPEYGPYYDGDTAAVYNAAETASP
jgi:V8-like Glu-specific endopeptidase